jgi:hypothetical protein
MSTLELENIKHPDNSGDNIALASNGSITIDRKSTDGTVAEFRKDGTAAGSISIKSDDLVIHSLVQNHAGLSFGDGNILPTNYYGTTSNNTVDIGSTSRRFKDFYLDGGIYLGGTGATNKLDDYEEGTWTPTLVGATITDAVGLYTKVGDLCHFQARLLWSAGGGAAYFGGLPFTAVNGGEEAYSMTITPYVNSGFGNLPSGKGWLNGFVNKAATTIAWYWQPFSSQASTTSSGNVYIQGSYKTAS